jgi:predicted RNA-binding Zn ribbon-like protein
LYNYLCYTCEQWRFDFDNYSIIYFLININVIIAFVAESRHLTIDTCMHSCRNKIASKHSKHILFDWFDDNLTVCCIATYAKHVNNDVSKHILFDWFDDNLAVCCIATYATHVNNDVSKHILFDWFDDNLAVCCITTYATHVNNDVSKHILFDWFGSYTTHC